MPFQKEVNTEQARGIPGMPYSLNPETHTVKFAGAGGVEAGKFCWLEDEDTVVSAAAGGPYGLVILTKYESLAQNLDDASMLIAEGDTASVSVKGERFVMCSTAAVAGDLVFVSNTDGTISAGTGVAPAGTSDTGWKVIQGGAAGELIAISAWR